jgi:hypothetical protein
MSLLRKFFGPDVVTAQVVAPAAAAPPDDSEARLVAALALEAGEAREAALLALACESRNPAVRLKAGAALAATASWQALMTAVQDRDRRVWKLMKDRLAEVRQRERAGDASAALEQALGELLAKHPIDLVRLVDIDKRWDAIKALTPSPGFDALRAEVAQRIAAEQTVQFELRRIIGATVAGLAQCREILTPKDLDADSAARLADLVATLRALNADLDALVVDEAPPAQLREARERLTELNQAVGAAVAADQRAREAREQAQALIAQVEGLEAASLALCQNLEQGWTTVALGNSAEDEALKEKFFTGLALLKAPHLAAENAARDQAQSTAAGQKETQDRLRALIVQAEEALERGAAAAAIKLADELRVLRQAAGRLSPGWKSRLVAAEKEVAKLRGWQRYTGEKLREELILAAEKLHLSHLAPDLLAKEITLMQDQWKKMDTDAGGAGKPLWERFHAATSAAYERVKVYREQQAKEREANAEIRKALIAEAAPLAAQFAEGNIPPVEAWRALPGQRSSLHDRWHNGGAINRGEMKTLQAEFAAHMAVLDNAAGNARKIEKQRKSLLIAEVEAALIAGQEALKEAESAPPAPAAEARPTRDDRRPARGDSRFGRDDQRGARSRDNDSRPGRPGPNAAPPALLKAMRVAQEAQKRWQEERHPMPLPRKEEQALWEAFRAKCSAIFALRDAKREEEKGKLAAQESVREVIIDKMLAVAEAADAGAASAHLSELATEWNGLERPDGASRKRYDDAVARARNRIDALRREAAAAVAGKLLAFDTELSRFEQAQAEGAAYDTAALATQQEELGKALARHKGLKSRAERILKGVPVGASADWAKLVAAGNHTRANLLLDLELTLGLDSPPDLAQARRTRQLERLAESMKNRAPAKPSEELLDALLALPAAPSEANVVRLAAIVAHLEKPRR